MAKKTRSHSLIVNITIKISFFHLLSTNEKNPAGRDSLAVLRLVLEQYTGIDSGAQSDKSISALKCLNQNT